jgi:hypothetical protein
MIFFVIVVYIPVYEQYAIDADTYYMPGGASDEDALASLQAAEWDAYCDDMQREYWGG